MSIEQWLWILIVFPLTFGVLLALAANGEADKAAQAKAERDAARRREEQANQDMLLAQTSAIWRAQGNHDLADTLDRTIKNQANK